MLFSLCDRFWWHVGASPSARRTDEGHKEEAMEDNEASCKAGKQGQDGSGDAGEGKDQNMPEGTKHA